MPIPGSEPRLLTSKEIEDIKSAIRTLDAQENEAYIRSPIPEISRFNTESMLQGVDERLRNIKITPLVLYKSLNNQRKVDGQYLDIILNYFSKARVQAGRVVALDASAALMALFTQMTLSSFHQAGTSKSLGSGIGRCRELLMITDTGKNDAMFLYFRRIKKFDDIILKKRPNIVYSTVKKVVKSSDFITKEEAMESPWYDMYQTAVLPVEGVDLVLRIVCDVNEMYSLRITMFDLAEAIERGTTRNNIRCVYSPMSEGIMDVYLLDEFRSSDAAEFFVRTMIDNFGSIAIKGIPGVNNIDPMTYSLLSVFNDEQEQVDKSYKIELNRQRMDINGVDILDLLQMFRVAGIKVRDYSDNFIVVETLDKPSTIISKLLEDDKIEDEKQPVAYVDDNDQFRFVKRSPIFNAAHKFYAITDGTNLGLVLYMDDIDPRYTYSNNLGEIITKFGIEAVRNYLIMELSRCVVAGADANALPLNRHIMIIADYITHRSPLVGISFSSLSSTNPGTLTQMTSESAFNTLVAHSILGAEEKTTRDQTSSSAAIAIGSKLLLGSGNVQIESLMEKGVPSATAFSAELRKLKNPTPVNPSSGTIPPVSKRPVLASTKLTPSSTTLLQPAEIKTPPKYSGLSSSSSSSTTSTIPSVFTGRPTLPSARSVGKPIPVPSKRTPPSKK